MDGDGNKLTLGKIPTFHVRIRASRREIIWTSDRSASQSRQWAWTRLLSQPIYEIRRVKKVSFSEGNRRLFMTFKYHHLQLM